MTLPDPLPAPYNRPPDPSGAKPGPETRILADGQVAALLERTPSFYALSAPDQTRLRKGLSQIGAYAAELVRDDWSQTKRLGQVPLVRQEKTYRPVKKDRPVPVRTQAARANLQTAATGQVADITQSTLRAIAFPCLLYTSPSPRD